MNINGLKKLGIGEKEDCEVYDCAVAMIRILEITRSGKEHSCIYSK